jgi:hypothetical protein
MIRIINELKSMMDGRAANWEELKDNWPSAADIEHTLSLTNGPASPNVSAQPCSSPGLTDGTVITDPQLIQSLRNHPMIDNSSPEP